MTNDQRAVSKHLELPMTDPATIREIQRLMDESRGAPRDPRASERRIAGLLGIDGAAQTDGRDTADEGRQNQPCGEGKS